MTTSPLLAATPCVACSDDECDQDGCTQFIKTTRVALQMAQVAALIAHEPDNKLRASETERIGDGYADVLGDYAARLDDEAWRSACGCAKAVAS